MEVKIGYLNTEDFINNKLTLKLYYSKILNNKNMIKNLNILGKQLTVKQQQQIKGGWTPGDGWTGQRCYLKDDKCICGDLEDMDTHMHPDCTSSHD